MRDLLRDYWRYILIGLFGGLVLIWLIATPTLTILGENTGFEEKTLWDWMEILLVPLVLALGALWFNDSQKKTELKIAEKARETDRVIAEEARKAEREIASERQQQATLEAYYDRMTELLLEHGLRSRNEEEGAEGRSIARTRTLSVVRSINEERKGHVIKFLYESKLIGFIENDEHKPGIVALYGMDLAGAKLSGAYLIGADLSGADLSEADLSGTKLIMAKLSGAKLVGANLPWAYLYGADLVGTQLREADLTGADLRGAKLIAEKQSRVDFRKAKLTEAFLREVFLYTADLYGAKLRGARYDRSTQWPEGFDPSANGATFLEE